MRSRSGFSTPRPSKTSGKRMSLGPSPMGNRKNGSPLTSLMKQSPIMRSSGDISGVLGIKDMSNLLIDKFRQVGQIKKPNQELLSDFLAFSRMVNYKTTDLENILRLCNEALQCNKYFEYLFLLIAAISITKGNKPHLQTRREFLKIALRMRNDHENFITFQNDRISVDTLLNSIIYIFKGLSTQELPITFEEILPKQFITSSSSDQLITSFSPSSASPVHRVSRVHKLSPSQGLRKSLVFNKYDDETDIISPRFSRIYDNTLRNHVDTFLEADGNVEDILYIASESVNSATPEMVAECSKYADLFTEWPTAYSGLIKLWNDMKIDHSINIFLILGLVRPMFSHYIVTGLHSLAKDDGIEVGCIEFTTSYCTERVPVIMDY